ncbi:MAG: hypothetical protein Kow0069_11630 [Promethearchaeota archaeon]
MRTLVSRSWTFRLFASGALVVVALAAGFIGAYQAILVEYYEFNDQPSSEAPFPLLELDEERLHVAVEGTESVGFLGAEERQARYHLPLGYVATAQFVPGTAPDEVGASPAAAAELARCSALGNEWDSPFLTGHYLAAQALRWNVYHREGNAAGVQAAETQVSRVLDGLFLLTHVSGVPGHLVRYAVPAGTFGEDAPDPFRPTFWGRRSTVVRVQTRWGDVNYPAVDFSGWIYADDTSRDQNLGAAFGLAAVLAFCDNSTLKARAGALVVEIVERFKADGWLVANWESDDSDARAGNSADFDLGFLAAHPNVLEFLKLASVVDPARYEGEYAAAVARDGYLATLSHETLLPSVATSYYPVNLAWESIWPLVYFEEGRLRERYLDVVEGVHYRVVKNHRNAFYQLLWLSLLPPERAAAETRVVAEVRDSLERMSRDRWDGFNYFRAANFSEVGHALEEDEWLIDSTSRKYANLFSGGFSLLNYDFSDLFPTAEHTRWAVPVDWRYPSDFIWQRTPFRYAESPTNRTRREYPHADFTLVYWLSRYLGLVGKPATPVGPGTATLAQVGAAWESQLPASYGAAHDLLGALEVLA